MTKDDTRPSLALRAGKIHDIIMIKLPASQLLPLLRRREISAEKLTRSYLEAIAKNDGKIRAFLHVDADRALTQARSIDERSARGEPIGTLAGLPVAIKDVLCTAGQPTTCGSKMLEKFVPPYDAHVITRLRQADAVFLGKTNMDEFAMGSSTENSAYQVTRNPWDLERIPGGSSGGSAAAVAACEAPLGLGTDTGGSIRQPAGLCGIVGLKPSYGRVSRFGLIAYGSSLDQIGPFAHDVFGTALLLEAIAGHDARDSTSVDQAVPSYTSTLEDPIRPLTIGVAREFFAAGLDAEVEGAVREALQVYKNLGAMHRGDFAAAQSLRDRHVLPRRHGRGVEQPGPLRRRPLRPSSRQGKIRRAPGHVRPDARRRLRRRGQTPDHARHVRSLERLRRRLLSQGPEGSPADQERLRPGVRPLRRRHRARPRRRRRSRSARRSTIRWRCICPTSTRSAPTWPASRA